MKLKLTGLDNFTSPLVDHAVLVRDQEVTVSNEVGEKLLALGGRTLNDNMEYSYFTKTADTTPPQVQESTDAPQGDGDQGAGTPPPAAKTARPVKTAQRVR